MDEIVNLSRENRNGMGNYLLDTKQVPPAEERSGGLPRSGR
jgi:hypothetical protein